MWNYDFIGLVMIIEVVLGNRQTVAIDIVFIGSDFVWLFKKAKQNRYL